MYTRQFLTGYLVKRVCPTSVNYTAPGVLSDRGQSW